MDEIDKKILAELQSNARLTNQELADRVALSPSPCLRRVRALEKQGSFVVITPVSTKKRAAYP